MQNIYAKARDIELLIFDVDGVLTTGSLYLDESGREYKAFNSRDGHGMRMWHESGLTSAIITGRTSDVVLHRCRDIGTCHIYQGQRNKRAAYAELLDKLNLRPEQVAYMGDDVVDLPIMSKVGLALCTADAHPFVQQHSHWISQYNGGCGAAREAIELILDAKGLLNDLLASYLK